MTRSTRRFLTVLTGVFAVIGLIPATAGGMATTAADSASSEPDGVVDYRVELETSGFERDCRRRNGRRVCRTHADFSAHIPEQTDEGESPDQSECRIGRTVVLYERTRSGRDRVDSGTTDEDGYVEFGTVTGVSRGDEFVAVARASTFSDRYGDLVTCASATSNTVTL